MPYAPHYRVTALGTLGTGEERFSFGISLSGGGDPEANSAAWSAVQGAFRLLFIDPDVPIHPSAALMEVKVASIGADGKYTAEPLSIPVPAPRNGVAGGIQTVTLPQSALAVSLSTERLGPGGRGRFYLPMPVVEATPADGYQIPSAVAVAIRNRAAAFLSAVNAQAPGTSQVVVASTKGYNTPVTGVRVGRLVDTIRSRRANLAENYTGTEPVTNA